VAFVSGRKPALYVALNEVAFLNGTRFEQTLGCAVLGCGPLHAILGRSASVPVCPSVKYGCLVRSLCMAVSISCRQTDSMVGVKSMLVLVYNPTPPLRQILNVPGPGFLICKVG
jgi:hypothetical protein